MATRFPPLLLIAFAAPFLASPQAHPTAVFTLDVQQRKFIEKPGEPVKAQLRAWAESCAIVPRNSVYALECPAPEPERPDDEGGGERAAVEASLGLFRDLDEVIYLAGCPVIQETKGEGGREPRRPDETPDKSSSLPKGVKARDLEDCRDIAAGQTFTTEVEDELLKIVIRGRQLPLTLFRVKPKEVSFNSPYEPRPARTRTALGSTSTRTSARAPEPGAEPEFEPPPLDESAPGSPSAKSSADIETAKTSLRTGRLVLECTSRQSAVYIEGAYYGACPMQAPLLAGRHEVRLQRLGRDDWVREVEITAGETTRLRVR